MEEAALRGEYRVVYVTPEKLVGSGGDDADDGGGYAAATSYFMSRLGEMARTSTAVTPQYVSRQPPARRQKKKGLDPSV